MSRPRKLTQASNVRSLSFFVPALNEEANIQATVSAIAAAAKVAKLKSYEVIIVNDGSTDETGVIIDRLGRRVPKVIPLHNASNMGIGASMQKALSHARYANFLIIPGDNDVSQQLVVDMLKKISTADMVLSYYINREVRGRRRNVISTLFNTVYMLTFGVFVVYINGPCIYPTAKLRDLKLKSKRFSVVVEATLKLLCLGCSYTEVAGFMQTGLAGSTSLSFRNLTDVIGTYLRLFWELRISEREKYSKQPTRVS